ncbi:MAG: hypothetical protein JW790_05345 [Dehalococcoidales bacterium]|nr:hypothetical protein [Dehalococcoidales bacterium]
MHAVQTIGLRKAYNKLVAVKGIDLEIDRQELFSLLGPNGAVIPHRKSSVSGNVIDSGAGDGTILTRRKGVTRLT